ncbi:hypothetical protein HY971_01565 [Candidatus Kaiserbacteria bacterium]|nr:hypothetical protein [Candidatus Kaiserbacteria bacterium]
MLHEKCYFFGVSLPVQALDYSNVIVTGTLVSLRTDDIGPENAEAIATIREVLPDKKAFRVVRIELSEVNSWAIIRGKGENGCVVGGRVVGELPGYIDVHVPLTLLVPAIQHTVAAPG